ncbi:NEK1 [Symbiodinium sp. CCMP2592]|nr:NEK1 [Symbiodinium sp. CCMP2592]
MYKPYAETGSAVDKLVLQLRDGSSRRYGFEGGDPVGPWTLDADELMPYKAEEWIHLFRQARKVPVTWICGDPFSVSAVASHEHLTERAFNSEFGFQMVAGDKSEHKVKREMRFCFVHVAIEGCSK